MVAYQFLYCYSMANGDMTGLFMTSNRARHPPGFSSGFLYRDSGGYDGQIYRRLAHDPLDRKEYWSYLGDPRYRSRRILIPAVAAVLGGGSSGAVDFWYVAVTDILLALGGLCFIRLAEDSCSRPAAAAIYLVIPAVTASTDRMVLDGPSLAGFLALWLFVKEDRKWAAWTVLILLPLIREAGRVFTAGAWIVWLQRRDRRGLLVGAATPTAGAGLVVVCRDAYGSLGRRGDAFHAPDSPGDALVHSRFAAGLAARELAATITRPRWNGLSIDRFCPHM